MSNQIISRYPWLYGCSAQLARYIEQDRLPSALMLVGEKGLGLATLAEDFAATVFCQQLNSDGLVCGTCQACLLFKAGNYPDYFHLIPEEGKNSIRIDVIRQLTASLSLNNQYLKPRIVIIDPADALLHQASNSLLKTLEEPSDNTCLILVTHDLSNISATIRSRCQLLLVNHVELKQAQQWLENLGCDSANKYLRLANNIPLFAQELWQKDALTAHNALFDGFIKLIKGQLDPLLFAEQCFSQQQLPMINWMLSWLADAIKVQLQTKAERIVDIDSLANLKVITERLHLESIYEIMDNLTMINRLEQSQVNQQLLLEEMAVRCYSLTINKGKS